MVLILSIIVIVVKYYGFGWINVYFFKLYVEMIVVWEFWGIVILILVFENVLEY